MYDRESRIRRWRKNTPLFDIVSGTRKGLDRWLIVDVKFLESRIRHLLQGA